MIKWIKKNRLGFTLVELMIILAILGILGAVVVTTFQDHYTETNETIEQKKEVFKNLP